MRDIKVNILGSDWTIKFGTEQDYKILENNDGITDSSVREIIVNSMEEKPEADSKRDLAAYRKQVIRHELVHAFLSESGLDGNGSMTCHWEHNEEMVDWFAIQSPKIFKVFKELDLM